MRNFFERKLFLVAIIVFCGLFVQVAPGAIVADAECPNYAGPWMHTPCTNIFTESCERTEGPVTTVSQGKIGKHTSSSICDCPNCLGCPDTPPLHMKCEKSLEVEYEDVFTWSIDPSVQFDVKAIQVTIGGSIGTSHGKKTKDAITCGAGKDGVPPCKHAAWRSYLAIKTGYVKQMKCTYNWNVKMTHNWAPLGCTEHTSAEIKSYPKTWQEAAGEKVCSVSVDMATDSYARCEPAMIVKDCQ